MRVAFIQKSSYEEIAIHFLAGALREAGICYDLFVEDLEKDFYDVVRRYSPSFIVHSMYIGEEHVVLEHLRKIKEVMPDVTTIVGGPFTLPFPDICHDSSVDFVLRGDGEFTLPRLLKVLSEQSQSTEVLCEIEGICFIGKDGREYRNDNLELVDIVAIPKPDRDLYYKYAELRRRPTKMFIAARGCPNRCTFCFNAGIAGFFRQKYWRQRSIQDVIEEIVYVKRTYGMEWVHFQDGTFNANKKWLKEFLKCYMEAGLPPFLCNVRVENVDEELVQLLQRSGCNRVTFGLETGNPRIRKEIAGRAASNEQIVQASKLFKKYGIRRSVDIIFGWPSETLAEAMDTIRLSREVDAESYSSNVLIFYPGLRVTEYAYEHGYIRKIPTLAEVASVHLNTSLLLSDQTKILINMDKLYFYLIKLPWLEGFFLWLLRFPPNRLFFMMKNLHLLFRALKYDHSLAKIKIIKNYMTTQWEEAGRSLS